LNAVNPSTNKKKKNYSWRWYKQKKLINTVLNSCWIILLIKTYKRKITTWTICIIYVYLSKKKFWIFISLYSVYRFSLNFLYICRTINRFFLLLHPLVNNNDSFINYYFQSKKEGLSFEPGILYEKSFSMGEINTKFKLKGSF